MFFLWRSATIAHRLFSIHLVSRITPQSHKHNPFSFYTEHTRIKIDGTVVHTVVPPRNALNPDQARLMS